MSSLRSFTGLAVLLLCANAGAVPASPAEIFGFQPGDEVPIRRHNAQRRLKVLRGGDDGVRSAGFASLRVELGAHLRQFVGNDQAGHEQQSRLAHLTDIVDQPGQPVTANQKAVPFFDRKRTFNIDINRRIGAK